MSIDNPIEYTSRTFNTVMTDINNDSELIDKPDWWKRSLAGVMDVFSMMLNGEANNAVLRTAFTRQAVTDLLALIDYDLQERQTSSGQLLFYIKKTASFPFSVAATDLVAVTSGTSAISAKRFEARDSSLVSLIEESVTESAVDISTSTITVSRDFTTGEKVILSGNDLPSPLLEDTEYWVLRSSATQIRLCESLSEAYLSSYIEIESIGTGNIDITLYSFFGTVYQQETKSQQLIGEGDKSSFQTLTLPDLYVIKDTLAITINSESYERVDSFVEYGSTDKVYKLIYNTDESSKIQFGNGDYGKIPETFNVYADYAVGGGADSNVLGIGNVTTYVGGESEIEAVSNPGEITGGSDKQGIDEAKILGPLLLKARSRFITTNDGASLALGYGGFSIVKVNKNAYGTMSAQVLCIANGGGNPDEATKAALQEYLVDRTILESIDVRVDDLTITPINVVSEVKVLSSYTWDNIKSYYDLAWKMWLSESGTEIVSTYEDSGITDAIDLINALFLTSFTTDDSTQITALIENLEVREIGESVKESDTLSYIDSNVFGVDYLTVSSPSFPVEVDDDEITTPGVITSTEVS